LTEEIERVGESFIRIDFKDAKGGYVFSLDMKGVDEQKVAVTIGHLAESMTADGLSGLNAMIERIYMAKVRQLPKAEAMN